MNQKMYNLRTSDSVTVDVEVFDADFLASEGVMDVFERDCSGVSRRACAEEGVEARLF